MYPLVVNNYSNPLKYFQNRCQTYYYISSKKIRILKNYINDKLWIIKLENLIRTRLVNIHTLQAFLNLKQELDR